jgi:hypothetical protein
MEWGVRLLPGSASLPPEDVSAQAGQHLLSFLRSGPKRVVFDVRNGVIAKRFQSHSVALGCFDNPLGESYRTLSHRRLAVPLLMMGYLIT